MSALAFIEFDWSQWLVPFSWTWKEESLCSVLVGIACGVLGCFVVLRRMALIGDALSHAILPGVVLAFIITQSTDISKLFLGALIAGVVAAVLIRIVSQSSRTKEDSAIGIVFTALFATGVILASSLPRGTHFDLKCFLFGDPLAVGRDDLIMMGVIAPLVLLAIFLFYNRLKLISFDPVVAAAMGVSVTAMHYLLMGLLSATVVAGLKTTGVVLVVAMVITPASAAYQLCDRLWTMLLLAGVFGAISAAAGMSLAFVTNSPTGPAMVLVATALFAISMLLSPKHGVVLQTLRRRNVRRHIDGEDIIKAIFRRAETGAPVLVDEVVRATGLTPSRVTSTVRALQREGLVTKHSEPRTSVRADFSQTVPLHDAKTEPRPSGSGQQDWEGRKPPGQLIGLPFQGGLQGGREPNRPRSQGELQGGSKPNRPPSQGGPQGSKDAQRCSPVVYLNLTPSGVRRANELVRAHRLWESYLADEAKIPMETIHDEAERLEHAHELADEIDAKLGFPTHDPHGEVIPALTPRDPSKAGT